MSINLETRLRKLEASLPSKAFRVHRVIGDSAEECEEQRQAVIEAGTRTKQTISCSGSSSSA
jgi:hypothetical protein